VVEQSPHEERVRAAEVIAALCLATDLGMRGRRAAGALSVAVSATPARILADAARGTRHPAGLRQT
jgi:hypothetical protein